MHASVSFSPNVIDGRLEYIPEQKGSCLSRGCVLKKRYESLLDIRVVLTKESVCKKFPNS